jgi:hypothetical protein
MSQNRFWVYSSNIGYSLYYIMAIIALVTMLFLITAFSLCTEDDCTIFSNTNMIVLILSFSALFFPLIVSLAKRIITKSNQDIKTNEIKQQLKNQFLALRNDYVQFPIFKNNLEYLLNQKNTRIIIINDLITSMIHYYREHAISRLYLLSGMALRNPTPFGLRSKEEFQKECEIMVDEINSILPHIKKKSLGIKK